MSKMLFSEALKPYQDLIDGEDQSPSVYAAAVKTKIEDQSVTAIRSRLEKILSRDDISEILTVETMEDGIKIALAGKTQAHVYKISFENEVETAFWAYESAEYRNCNLLEDERMEMHQTPQIVECFTFLNLDDPLQDLMIQFAVLDAIAGESYAIFDPIAELFYSGTWLNEMALSYTPPSLEMMYTIHAVVPDENQNPDDYWLHTHGLGKFSLPELEVLQGKQNATYIYQELINALAIQLIYDREMITNHDFVIAYGEDRYIEVSLLPWQEAVTSDLLITKKGLFKKKVQPFSGDLNDRDDAHGKPAMVLFGYINEQVCHLNDYGDVLNNDTHIVRFLPNEETERMTALAKEKFALLQQCFQHNPPQSEQWNYTLKMACTSNTTEAREHMWFELKAIQADHIQAVLINDPFNIPEMKNGDMLTLSLDKMTDWAIYSSPMQSRITPNDTFKLRRYLRAN